MSRAVSVKSILWSPCFCLCPTPTPNSQCLFSAQQPKRSFSKYVRSCHSSAYSSCHNPARASVLVQTEAKVCKAASETLHDLALCVLSHHCVFQSLNSSPTAPLPFLKPPGVLWLRGLALALPSIWKAFPPDIHLGKSFKSLISSHLLNKTFCDLLLIMSST